MSLRAWIGSKIEARIEAMPSMKAEMERSERIGPVIRSASRMAESSLDDEAAKAELAQRLEGKDQEVLEVLKGDLFQRRDDYVQDRSYRLLSAVASNTVVEPIPIWREPLFRQEEELGRMPMEQAFHRLAEIEPRLLSVERMARSPGYRLEDDNLPKEIRHTLGPLMGRPEGERELLSSNLASSVVNQYLLVLLGWTGTPETSYFEAPRKISVARGMLTFGRGARKESQGQAFSG